MPLLIDGDNLLGTSRRPRTGTERRRLAIELDRLARRERRRVVTVFDGRDPGSAAFGADVRFSGPGRTADELIVDFLRRESDPRGWQVVTSDRPLGDRCRWIGARVIRCDQFRGRLTEPGDSEKPDREGDIDYWLGQFGDDS